MKPVIGSGVPMPLVMLLVVVAIAAFAFGLFQSQTRKDYNRAVSAYNAGDYTSAMSTLDQVIGRNPRDADALTLRCESAFMLKDDDHALADCSKAISLEAGRADAYFYRGLAYARTDRQYNAVDDFRKVLEINPDHPAAKYMKQYIAQYAAPAA